MYTGSITIPRRVCVWVIYTGNRDLPRWSFSDVVVVVVLSDSNSKLYAYQYDVQKRATGLGLFVCVSLSRFLK